MPYSHDIAQFIKSSQDLVDQAKAITEADVKKAKEAHDLTHKWGECVMKNTVNLANQMQKQHDQLNASVDQITEALKPRPEPPTQGEE